MKIKIAKLLFSSVRFYQFPPSRHLAKLTSKHEHPKPIPLSAAGSSLPSLPWVEVTGDIRARFACSVVGLWRTCPNRNRKAIQYPAEPLFSLFFCVCFISVCVCVCLHLILCCYGFLCPLCSLLPSTLIAFSFYFSLQWERIVPTISPRTTTTAAAIWSVSKDLLLRAKQAVVANAKGPQNAKPGKIRFVLRRFCGSHQFRVFYVVFSLHTCVWQEVLFLYSLDSFHYIWFEMWLLIR